MKALIIIAIALSGLSAFAQGDVKFDMWQDQRNQEFFEKRDKSEAFNRLRLVQIIDDCHDVSWFESTVEERIQFQMEDNGIHTLDFDYIADCQKLSDFLTLNSERGISRKELESKRASIRSQRAVINKRKSERAKSEYKKRKAYETFPTGPKF